MNKNKFRVSSICVASPDTEAPNFYQHLNIAFLPGDFFTRLATWP